MTQTTPRSRPQAVDVFAHRAADYALAEEQQDFVEGLRALLERHCRAEEVRAAAPTGVDAELVGRLAEIGLYSMALPAAVGGDEATFVDLALVATELGRALAPVPWVESVVAGRLLAAVAPDGDSRLSDPGARTATIVCDDAGRRPDQLVPAGAYATARVQLDGDALSLVTLTGPPPAAVANPGALPLAPLTALSGADSVTLCTGDAARAAHAGAMREWRVLTAARLAGLSARALELAVAFAAERRTHGVAIGALQAIAHQLAEGRVRCDVAANLALRAAWYEQHEPDPAAVTDRIAFVQAARTATAVATMAAHVHGGAGVSREYDVTLCFDRAKGWSTVAGDPAAHLPIIGAAALAQREDD